MRKKVLKIIEDDDESDKQGNQDLITNKNNLINKKEKQINYNSSLIQYTEKNIDKAISENNQKLTKNNNKENASSETRLKYLYPSKTINLPEMNESYINSLNHTDSNYSQNNFFYNNSNNVKNFNYNPDKLTNIIIQKKILSDYPITYEEVKSKMKAHYNRKIIQRQKMQSSYYESKNNDYDVVESEIMGLRKNEQLNNFNINNNVLEEKIKKKLSSNVSKSAVVEHIDNNSNHYLNNQNLKKANEHFGFNPNNIIINSNNNYNNINLNIINKDRGNEIDKNMIPKSKHI